MLSVDEYPVLLFKYSFTGNWENTLLLHLYTRLCVQWWVVVNKVTAF